ncbi:hypothetical protein SmJEL517_g02595 [Synchytrium microbalum]|uniref:Uncharacterized protein n=1 Tax=Synchytrium microbalum TaxID=1806994 RepID=A0A507C5Y4_9FUNG|nr:uncharacterized protein SmJEL517_g02595 [Synchytrium microbalum]TPX34921.1 hypothetical protein SmJEL517_g02595 [Synchytrium microbalum]
MHLDGAAVILSLVKLGAPTRHFAMFLPPTRDVIHHATIKLGALLVRTIAKPFANAIKNQAKQHERFKEMCIGLAQWTHKVEMTLKMNFFGYKVETIRPLNDAKAVELGANFISESIIFRFETWRQRKNTKARYADVDGELEKLETESTKTGQNLEEVRVNVDALRKQIEDLRTENQRLYVSLDKVAQAVHVRLEREREWSEKTWTQKIWYPFSTSSSASTKQETTTSPQAQ